MRTRIALAAAMAVTVFVVPAVLVSLFSDDPASAGATGHKAVSVRPGTSANPQVMSYDQARQVAAFVTYTDAVTLAQEEAYLKEVAFFETLQRQSFYNAILRQQAQAAAARAQAAAAARAAQAPAAAPAASPAAPSASDGWDATSTNTPHWACIRAHESGGNYSVGGGGAYQFELGTWRALTGLTAPAQDYPPAVQDAAALKLFSQRGWQPWTTRWVCGL